MTDLRDSLAQVVAISLDRDLDVLPPWPALPEPWTTASVSYAEDGETCTQSVWTEKQLRAFGKACAQAALDAAGPALLAMMDRHGAGDAEDAARYRWLKDRRDVLLVTGFFGNCCVNKSVADVDTAIDAARAGERGPTCES